MSRADQTPGFNYKVAEKILTPVAPSTRLPRKDGRRGTRSQTFRYLINSQMEPKRVRDADGGITLYIPTSRPAGTRSQTGSPAPKGLFFMVLREYWPKPEALDGSGKVPQPVRHSVTLSRHA